MGDNKNKKKANPVDTHVGARIRLRRNMIGMSQEKLGDSLGITFQQVQKYEKGTNRVGASRLQAIAEVLGVPVSFFFDDAPGSDEGTASGFAEDSPERTLLNFSSSAEGLQLTRAYTAISDPKVRRKVLDLVKALGAASEP